MFKVIPNHWIIDGDSDGSLIINTNNVSSIRYSTNQISDAYRCYIEIFTNDGKKTILYTDVKDHDEAVVEINKTIEFIMKNTD